MLKRYKFKHNVHIPISAPPFFNSQPIQTPLGAGSDAPVTVTSQFWREKEGPPIFTSTLKETQLSVSTFYLVQILLTYTMVTFWSHRRRSKDVWKIKDGELAVEKRKIARQNIKNKISKIAK